MDERACRDDHRRQRARVEVGALADQERQSPRRVLLAVARPVGAHVVEHADVCRVLLEARTLAAYEPEIASAVEASAGTSEAAAASSQPPRRTDPRIPDGRMTRPDGDAARVVRKSGRQHRRRAWITGAI
ncbi:MAG: hypothetical protein ACRD0B_06575, partial [Acidimicrobiales bacterium]